MGACECVGDGVVSEGACVGACVGECECVGDDVISVGYCDGARECEASVGGNKRGASVGDPNGKLEGEEEKNGLTEGDSESSSVGESEGCVVESTEGGDVG